MKNKKISVILLSLLLFVGVIMTSCKNKDKDDQENGEIFTSPDYNVTHYDNKDFSEYYKGNETTLKGQWTGYGVGDPFIMRYNGMYYLYVSTMDSETGIKAWKSENLITWAQCQGEGLDLGYVSQDSITRGAYAPEVAYFNGLFYMYTSPGGRGHYVLTSTHPEGPFIPVTDNLGFSIDGSVFIDDDEKIYFTRADGSGIRMHKMDNMTDISSSSIILDNTSIGGWTEGPYILKTNGKYYITYTGTSVVNDSYKVSYAVSNNNKLYSREAFSQGANLPILLETDNDFKGLGHSSTFLGPDMDSYYMAYHSLNSVVGPNRNLNIDRLLISGNSMSVASNLTGSVAAQMPSFSVRNAEGLSSVDGGKMSATSTASVYTAEFNFKGTDNVKFAVNYIDSKNYIYAKINFQAKSITLNKVSDGNETKIAEGTLINDFDVNSLHTVRIAYADGKMDLYFDNMQKISNAQIDADSGKIGYISSDSNLVIGYTAFSDSAKGLSDRKEIKQSMTDIPASAYIPENMFQGVVSNRLTGTSGISTVNDSSSINGANELTLNQKNDFTRYLLEFKISGFYGLEMIFDKKYCGKTIGVQIDGGDILKVKVPEVETNSNFVKVIITELDVTKGVRLLKVENVGDEFGFVSLSFVKTSKYSPSYSNSLANYASNGVDYKSIWKLNDGGHYAQAGTRQLATFGDETLTDFTLSVDVKLVGSTATSTAGILFHSGRYSATKYDDYRSIQGYYVALNNNLITLQKLNYSYSSNLAMAGEANVSDQYFTIKIEVRGNKFKIYKNNTQVAEYTDDLAFTSGKIGLYTKGAAVIYKNLAITA